MSASNSLAGHDSGSPGSQHRAHPASPRCRLHKKSRPTRAGAKALIIAMEMRPEPESAARAGENRRRRLRGRIPG